MFVKRDYRKIDVVLSESTESKVTTLRLPNRKEEFKGSLQALIKPQNLPILSDLKSLNVYANDISSLQGIGGLSETLEELNLGNNKISSIPVEFGALSNLKILYLEDNEIDTFQIALCQLKSLVELRLSGNLISSISQSIQSLERLEILVCIMFTFKLYRHI